MAVKTGYISRLTDVLLQDKINTVPAVLVRGPKWTGKTSSCQLFSQSALMLREPDVYLNALETARIRPSLLLQGSRPRLIDEWQVAPVLWDAVISEVDKNQGQSSQFLLTGSAVPPDLEQLFHTGTGRIARLTMSTFTLEESSESTKQVSLSALFSQGFSTTGASGSIEVQGISQLSIEDYAHIICRGGWPAVVASQSVNSISSDYIEALCESDISEAADVSVDPLRARALIRSLARNTAQEANLSTILADVKNSGIGMSDPTLRLYLNALRRLFVLEEIKAWSPALRSRTPLRTSPVFHLCDVSLAAAALGVNSEGLLKDLISMGYLFESLCIHDLRVYARLLNGEVYHYRDKNGLEADAIISLPDGRWAGIEIKLGGEDRIEEAARNLSTLANKVDKENTGAPVFLMVLTGGKFAYTRPDGVHVVPLGCLGH